MLISIDNIVLENFGSPSPASGGTPAVVNYDGSPLYCHVRRSDAGDGKVVILIDESPPHEFFASGAIASVTLRYQFDPNVPQPDMVWDSGLPSGSYNGEVLAPFLKFSADKSHASLVIEQTDAAAMSSSTTSDEHPVIGLVVVGPELTMSEPRGYFVTVPVNPSSDFRSLVLGRVVWPKKDSVSGPIGSVNVP